MLLEKASQPRRWWRPRSSTLAVSSASQQLCGPTCTVLATVPPSGVAARATARTVRADAVGAAASAAATPTGARVTTLAAPVAKGHIAASLGAPAASAAAALATTTGTAAARSSPLRHSMDAVAATAVAAAAGAAAAGAAAVGTAAAATAAAAAAGVRLLVVVGVALLDVPERHQRQQEPTQAEQPQGQPHQQADQLQQPQQQHGPAGDTAVTQQQEPHGAAGDTAVTHAAPGASGPGPSLPVRVLLAQRPAGKANAGLWEFPGGKVDAGETPEAALVRELSEELGIRVEPSDLEPLTFASHSYPAFHLLMPLYVCRRWRGAPVGAEGQAVVWASAEEVAAYPLTPADVPLVPAVLAAMRQHGGDRTP